MSDSFKALEATLNRIVLDPKYHDALSLVKGMRNGIVYGTRVRFPHALVMIFLFRSGTFRQKVWLVFKATRQHARNLAVFALIYKSAMIVLNRTSSSAKPASHHPFIAGLLGGYYVFGRHHNSVNQQIVIYVFARVMLAAAKLAIKPRDPALVDGGAAHGGLGLVDPKTREFLTQYGWSAFASLSWACVMWLFRWHPELIQASLRSSMTYIYQDSDSFDSIKTLLWHNK